MKHFKQIISGLLVTLMLLSCNSKNKIIGEWECYGDPIYGGQLIKIEKFGSDYNGIRMNLLSDDESRGWNIGDICWKNIRFIEKNKYSVSKVGKGVQNGVQIIDESDGIIIIEDNDVLITRDLVTDKRITGEGKERRYKRVK